MRKKLMIIGDARHGKDTVAELLRDIFDYTFTSSSKAACELFIFDKLKDKYGYKSVDECFEDRVNHRSEWYDIISQRGEKDPTGLSRYILENNDIYVGCRNPNEFYAAKDEGLFDVAIWVDASKRCAPEDKSSNKMEPYMADYIIKNNGDIEDLEIEVINAYFELKL